MNSNGSLEASTTEAIARLEAATLVAEGGWLAPEWTRTTSEGVTTKVRMNIEPHQFAVQVGIFEEFELGAHEGLDMAVDLELPSIVQGVNMAGQPLELTINSLRPVDITVNGQRVFKDDLPVVASGPALVNIVDAISPGYNGRLQLSVLPSPTPLGGEWGRTALTVHLSTPALRDRWRKLDLTHARFMLAREFADTDDTLALLANAAAALPTDFDVLPVEALEHALNDATFVLDQMPSTVANHRIHCVGHSHIDLAWLWTYEDTREVIFRDMDSVLSLFDDYPEFRFTHSQARSYAEVESSHPEMFARLVDRVREGRLEPASMQWVEADTNMPSGEAHARQLIEGVAYTQQKLGTTPSVFFAPDAFGHAGNLPQLATQAGGRVYYHHRANPGFVAGKQHWQAYWWVGDDGSRILAVATPTYFGPISATRLARDVIRLGTRNGLTEVCFFYGVGDHGGGPTRQDLDYIRQLNGVAGFPEVVCSTVSEYANALLATDPDLPIFHGESERVFEGCYTSHADAKAANRLAENALDSATTLAALAGIDATAEVSNLWRSVLHHQFHDILGGSAVAGAFQAQQHDVSRTLDVTRSVASRALAILHAGLPEGSLAVTNSLGYPRRDIVTVPRQLLASPTGVTDAEGKTVASQRTADGSLVFLASLEAFETRHYLLSEVVPTDDGGCSWSVATDWTGKQTIEVKTPFYRAQLLPGAGIIMSLVDANSDQQLVGRGALSPESGRQLRPDLGLGALVYTHELPHEMSSWVEDDTMLERTLLSSATTTVIEQGSVRLVFQTVHQQPNFSTIVRTAFYNDVPWLDYRVDVDWRAVGNEDVGIPGLMISFGTSKKSLDLWAETPFAAARREPDGYRSPMLKWADIGSPLGGLAVANDAKYGVDALGPRLRIPILRSAYDPDPSSDVGRIDTSRFRVLPHEGSWQDAGVVEMAAGLNRPLLCGRVTRSEADTKPLGYQPPNLDPSGSVVIDSLEHTSDGARLRLHESGGHVTQTRIVGLVPGSDVVECTIVGVVVQTHRANEQGMLTLPFRQFEVKTLDTHLERGN